MNVRDMLIRDEGVRHEAYRDTRGIWTIGIGHTGPEVCAGLVWDDFAIDAAFQLDESAAWQGVQDSLAWFAGLNEPRQAVLISLCFQLGLRGLLEFHATLGALRDEHYADAAAQLLRSDLAKQTPARARREARQLETGEWQ